MDYQKLFIEKLSWSLITSQQPSKTQSISFNNCSYFEFCTLRTLSRNAEPTICVEPIFWLEHKKGHLNFLRNSLFFATLGLFSTPFHFKLWWTVRSNWVKTSPVDEITFEWVLNLYRVWRKSNIWYVKWKLPNRCKIWSKDEPISRMWN